MWPNCWATSRSSAPQAFEAGALYLRRLGDTRPVVVVVLDDLHWADEGSLEFMRFVLQRDGDVPLLSLTLTRQTMYEQHADWMRGEPRHTRLDLKPLDHAYSQELAEALLQRLHGVPEALRALVIDGAEGNPFYMEELVKMLIDDGVIAVEAEGWRVVDDKLLRVHVPPTLTGVLQARLDALGADEHRAMQQAAVVGHVFWDQALAAIDPKALDCLPLLLQKQLVVQARRGRLRRHARVHVQAPSAAPGDLRQRAQGAQAQRPCQGGRVLERARRGGWAGRGGPGEMPGTGRGAVPPLPVRPARTMSVGSSSSSSHYLDAYAAQTLRPLAEQLIGVCERQFGPEHPEDREGPDQSGACRPVQGTVD